MSVSVKATMPSSRDSENYVNYAAVHCGMPIVDKVELSGDYTGKAILSITGTPAFIFEFKKEISLTAGTPLVIQNPELKLDDGFFRQEVIEARDGEIKVEVLDTEDPQKVLGFCNVNIHIQPYLHWDAWRHKGTMPAFMQPNDSYVAKVLKKAGDYAVQNGVRMYGYQGGTTQSVLLQAKSIYQALQEHSLHYISPPASFEDVGQKIRIPRQVLHDDSSQGTCLDLAILYATCLEAASLNSVLVLIRGHAFAAVWVKDGVTLPKYLVLKEEIDENTRQLIKDALIPVECTTFTDDRNISFESAVQVGQKNMEAVQYLIDVEKSRRSGIVPAYTYTDKPICEMEEQKEAEFELDMASAKEQLTKAERLQQQAMDITIRNKLLSGKKESFELEFPFDAERFLKEKLNKEQLFKEAKHAVLKSGVTEESVEEKLHKLRLNDREARREKGKGNLYLTVNELSWKTQDNKTYKAVLYLCPAEIYRNKRGEYLFQVNADETFFNPVLKQMLIQDHNIDISEMKDQPVQEYNVEMERLKYLLAKKNGWSIQENVARLGLFHIPNEAIWKGLSDETVLKHPIVNSLVQGAMDWKEAEMKEAEVDRVYAFQADSSQSEIIDAAFKRQAQVVIGPAGNGKTQTIANIMVEGIREGKKVLFVSEKYTALDVTRKMLEEAGIGMFTLEVVEGKHSVSEVSKQITETLDYVESSKRKDWEPAREEKIYKNTGDKLREYYAAMTRKGSDGKSLEELYNLSEQYRLCPVVLKWPKEQLKVDMEEAESIIEKVEDILKEYDQTQGKYADYLKYQDMDRTEKVKAQRAVEKVLGTGEMLLNCAEELRRALEGAAEDAGIQSLEKSKLLKMLEFSQYIMACPVIGPDLDEVLNTQGTSEEEALREELLDYAAYLRENDFEAGKFRFGFKRDDKRKKEFAEALKELNISGFKIMELRRMTDPDRLEEEIRNLDLSGNAKNSSVTGKKAKYYGFIEEVSEGLQGYSVSEAEAMKEALHKVASGFGEKLQDKANELLGTYELYAQAQDAAEQMVLQNVKGFEKKHPDKLKMVLFEEWKRNINKSPDLNLYQKIKKQAQQAGLGEILEQIESEMEAGNLEVTEIFTAFKKSWCEEAIRRIKDEFEELREFNHIDYQYNIRHYKKSEEAIRAKTREELFYMQMNRLPDFSKGEQDPELGKLQKLVRKKSKKVRELFENAPHILADLYPCMLMNPSAVAEYLPQDFPEFDVVIIDEGSQLPTYKALIPISHGKRCMIFGDEQQLTPTKCFQKNLEEDGYFTPMESVLEDAIVASLPRKMLRYHYRSEKESLITFSNKKYYNGKVITFPSCNTKIEGVSYEFVEDGCYDRGGTKTNEKEAMRVIQKVKEIYEGLSEDTRETVGIITMNLNQKNLIQSLLIKEAVNDSEFGTKVDDLVSVINLEACQGREWDHVILSPAYGVDKNGDFSINMGPLGHEGGENRLNVLITRARKHMYVVTSLKPAMLKDANSVGISRFKEFLMYASGDMTFDTRNLGNEKESLEVSSMIDNVAALLRKEGYTVHTNIGSSECKVDIGIVSKKDEEVYCLGILADHFKEGEAAVRDKEIIYPEALRRKGWNIYRLHSLSWYANPEWEMKRILEAAAKAEEGEK